MKSVVSSSPSLQLVAESIELDAILHDLEALGVEVVLLGVRGSITNGIRDLQNLKERCPGIDPVVMASAESEPYLRQLLLAGARGYLPVDCGRQELVDAVRGASRGKCAQVPAHLVSALLDSLSAPDSGPASPSFRRTARLTEREHEVLQEMATGDSYRAIADKLFLAESTIKKYAHSVLTKLGASNRSTAVIHAFRLNLIEEPSPEEVELPPQVVHA